MARRWRVLAAANTQLPLKLDRFDGARSRINDRIDASAEIALREIKALAEHHRRSLGQIVRWQEWRISR